MAHAPSGWHPCVTGIKDRANDNEIPILHTNDANQELPGELIEGGYVTDENMVIVRDSISSDWLVEDYASETVLFHMPRDCSLDEVRRAAAVYAAAFKSGFEQARFVACSKHILR
jgi:hypothetical protein